MNKTIFILLLSLAFIYGCSDNNPVTGTKIRKVTYKVTGSPNDVLITIIGASGVTQYNHVVLPFDLMPFEMMNGDAIGFNVVDWLNSDSLMTAEIIVDGSVYKTVTAAGLVELYGNAP
jgi:hypothetical protein